MPELNTLYVIGAGASSEVNLPTGNQLKREISNLLNIEYEDGYTQYGGDVCITRSLHIHSANSQGTVDLNSLHHASRQISSAMPQAISIDNFIDTHSGNKNIELCGKLAIVKSILQAEQDSLLYVDKSNIYNNIDFDSIADTWYSKFMMLLTENCNIENLSERLKTIALIVFNYDRCIEHFMFHSLQNYYGISHEQSAELVSEIKIYHPYGVVGNLPWQGGNSIEFGADPHPSQLLELASKIKTFTEGTDEESSEIITIRNHVSEAKNIVFLGFAFHGLNMKLMKPSTFIPELFSEINIYGSAFGISDSDCEIIKEDLDDLTDKDIKKRFINNKLKCADLFNEYWRSLSLNNA